MNIPLCIDSLYISHTAQFPLRLSIIYIRLQFIVPDPCFCIEMFTSISRTSEFSSELFSSSGTFYCICHSGGGTLWPFPLLRPNFHSHTVHFHTDILLDLSPQFVSDCSIESYQCYLPLLFASILLGFVGGVACLDI